ncbi:hypothetical protein P9112_000137 [Eukaryota sp. TZLM1-RC]
MATYRDSKILHDDTLPFDDKAAVARVVVHETAHHWMGNLVTLSDWSLLFLNEGFARFLEYMTVSELYPELNQSLNYLIDCRHSALFTDGLDNTHSLSVEVESVGEVEQIFSPLSYSKGSNLLYMIQQFVGKDYFKRNVQNYVKLFEFSNANDKDLFNCLKQGAQGDFGENFDAIIENFVNVPGFPYVYVDILNQSSNQISFLCRQYQFKTFNQSRIHDTLWTFPLKVDLLCPNHGNHQEDFLIKEFEQVLTISKHCNCPSLTVLINSKGDTFCRSFLHNSDLRSRQRFVGNQNLIDDATKIVLLSDVLSFATNSTISLGELIQFICSFSNSKSSMVWKMLAMCFDLLLIPSSEKCLEFLEIHVINPLLINLLPNDFDFKNFGNLDPQFIKYLLIIARDLNSIVLKHFFEKFSQSNSLLNQSFNQMLSMIHPELFPVFLSILPQYLDNSDVFHLFIDFFNETEHPTHRKSITKAIGRLKGDHLSKALDWGLLTVRTNDLGFLLSSASDTNPNITWNFFIGHFEELRSKSGGLMLFGNLIKAAASGFKSQEGVSKLVELLSTHDDVSIVKPLKIALERVRGRVCVCGKRFQLDSFITSWLEITDI